MSSSRLVVRRWRKTETLIERAHFFLHLGQPYLVLRFFLLQTLVLIAQVFDKTDQGSGKPVGSIFHVR